MLLKTIVNYTIKSLVKLKQCKILLDDNIHWLNHSLNSSIKSYTRVFSVETHKRMIVVVYYFIIIKLVTKVKALWYVGLCLSINLLFLINLVSIK